jgi:signal transduction histidine kinase
VIAFIFLGWTLYGILVANLVYGVRTVAGLPRVSLGNLVRYQLPEAWLWALLTFPILALARRFPVTGRTWWARVPLHLVFAILVHVVIAVTMDVAHPFVRAGGPRPEMPERLLMNVFFDLFIYAGIVATWHAAFAQGQALRLRNELLEAELRMLRMQLQPHFLFNTLNAVSELIHRDPARAERALARLGDLLRWSLQSSSLKEVTLAEELAALEIYLDIQRLRHGDGLVLRVAADPAALDAAVPSLLLQPLVENAIRHGVRGARAGRVEIAARRENGRLRLTVDDDGTGLAPGFAEGTGLRATRARLAGLYGEEQSLRLVPRATGGTSVEVVIPARAGEERT